MFVILTLNIEEENKLHEYIGERFELSNSDDKLLIVDSNNG